MWPTYADVAADELLAVAFNGASMMCRTPLDTRMSDWMIWAAAVWFSPEDTIPMVTKLPLEFDMNVYGSPAADVQFRDALNRSRE